MTSTTARYADALARGRNVHLLLVETTGALSPDIISLVRQLDRYATEYSSDSTTV